MAGTPQSHLETPASPEADDPEIGQVIDGRYRIVSTLGVGGMGAVYRAEHVGMGKHVAVKLLHAHVSARRDAGSRFRREAYAGGKIDHPNCVAVSDFGERDDGTFYLVMELLVGESLRDLLDREERVPWPRALGIARHLLRGLAYAHQQGVVHRDIKPENIFLCRHDDDPEFAKILDFGIAKLIGAGAADMSTVTQAGMTVGTPTYLSPEQAFGGKIGPASDLYSLSILLFEMLMGRPPFDDDEPINLLTAHATRPVPWFEELAPGIGIPPSVEELVRRGLAKTTDERYASADDYVMDIDRVRAELAPGLARAMTLPPFGAVGEPLQVDGSAPVARFGTPYPMGSMTPYPGTTPYPHAPGAGAMLTVSGMTALPPRRRPWLGWTVAALLTVGVIAAIATGGGNAGPAAAPGPASGKSSGSSAAPKGRAAATPTPVPVPVPVPIPAPIGDSDVDSRLKAALHDLDAGASCVDRKKAVAALRDLGDARAIPALKKARYRMRGGILGLGDRNTNACLKPDADAAIAALK